MDTKQLAGRILSSSGVQHALDVVERGANWPVDRLNVLTYHRVDRPSEDGRATNLISADPDEFGRQIDVLRSRFEIVGIDDVLDAVRGSGTLPDRAVLLTFDDAVDDFETNVWPVLRAHGLPSVLFVPTAFASEHDASFWWDALHAAITTTSRVGTVQSPVGRLDLSSPASRKRDYRRVREHVKRLPWDEVPSVVEELCRDLGVDPPPSRVLSWPSLLALHEAGVAVCAHTRTHPHLDRMSRDAALGEIEGSMQDLRRELGSVLPVFAYPAGRHDDAVVDLVRECGVELAFTTESGPNDLRSCDPLTLRRVNVSPLSGLGTVRIRMHPWYERIATTRGRVA